MKTVMMIAMLALAGCNTVAGVGQDISGGAERVGGWMGPGY
ncbi:entericidin [Cereibacter changlensis]|jgi:predicted small secreted protein|uniref:Entericidin n=1 Tax=Cereibacter changlensis TaxID=402884 RepID=A0A4U0YXB3_9RHOB|nr:entericidin [Cereibacter changlensis]TKA95266.1 entericidin [Cereibacter changlensis]